MVAMRESVGEFVKLPVARRERSKPQKIESRSSGRPRALPRAPSQVAEVRFATATLKARASPVEQITKGIDARADLQSVEPNPEWQSPPAKRIRVSDDGSAPIADPRPIIPTQAKRCLSARRSQSTADGGASGYANTRFTVAQNAQDSNRVVDTAGNLVNVG